MGIDRFEAQASRRVIQVVVVRDPSGRMRDCYLFTTDLQARLSWVITQFAWRWAIEVLFRASKQVLDIEAPQQWSQESVEKVAPWVWSMQSVLMVWYVTAGHGLPEAVRITILFDPERKPRRDENAKRSEDEEKTPMTFQTIARLDLAEYFNRQAVSSSSKNSASGNQTQQTQNQNQPDGGAQ